MRDRPAFDLFLVSWLVLFLELACIRWFPAHVLFLTFFVNLVLLACFVGMSVGCLVARRPTNYIRHTPYWLLLGVTCGLLVGYNSNYLQTVFAVGNQAQADVVYFGTETSITHKKPLPFVVPIELVGALFFAIIAAIMVGPGQEMGRAFNRVPNRTASYSANLLGSLVGIGMFAGCSYLRLPPAVWFGMILVVMAYLLGRGQSNDEPAPAGAAPAADPVPARRSSPVCELFTLAALGVVVIGASLTSGFKPVDNRTVTWSEYYRVDYEAHQRLIVTNLISQQLMEPMNEPTAAAVPYSLPYLFQRDLVERGADGKPVLGADKQPKPLWQPFKKVLIIGAGNGNDVTRALTWAAPDAEIDAVEIDPVIQKLGSLHHPDRPFQDKRVKVHINDGRNFLRKAEDGTYDLVVFALIDSLVLQSGYSNLRLESYLFTLESFQDVKRVLKPTGVYAVYNFFRQGWIAARIFKQLQIAFGCDPVVLVTRVEPHLPPINVVKVEEFDPSSSTGFFAGSPEVVGALRKEFERKELNAKGELAPVKYWYPWYTGIPKDTKATFSATMPAEPPHKPALAARRVRWVKDAEGKNTDVPVKDANGNVVLDEIPPTWMELSTATVEPTGTELRLATDDWPFVYTRKPQIPMQAWTSIALTFFLSIGIWMLFGGRQALSSESGVKPDYGSMLRAFFLGAGFMLVETKAVTQMALLFGGTWMVNTAVFAAILVMSLAGNLFAGRVNPKRLEPYYIGLFITIVIGMVVSLNTFLGLPATIQIVLACTLVFAPIAFAGVIFATSFKRTAQPDRVFGANVAGALLGGLAENTSVALGFQLLLCVAAGFYLLSAAFGNPKADPDAGASASQPVA